MTGPRRGSGRPPAWATVVFFLVGPGLEAGLGPALVTRGWERGYAFPAHVAWSAAGAVLVAAGVTVLVRAFMGFAREGRGTPTPAAPTGELVVTGAYRYVRNPMYLATAATIAGEGLVLSRPILLVAAPAYAATLAACARRWEEPELERRFGDAYVRYRAHVPGWWPRRRPWRP